MVPEASCPPLAGIASAIGGSNTYAVAFSCAMDGRTARNSEALANVLLLTARQAAARCGVSLRTWWRKVAAGEVPAAISIGGGSTRRWRADELRRWTEAGCPPRAKWAQIEQFNSSRRGGATRSKS